MRRCMQQQVATHTDPKNRFRSAAYHSSFPGGSNGGGGPIKMSNKSDVLAIGARPQGSDVASQTARALYSLRESLMRGEFAPGERMSELPLVARFGVSRTPIRLALERLAHMGLLDVNANGGFTVRGYTPSEAL